MTNNQPKSDELEEALAIELRHTLKLVPQSQRELFVTELARWYAPRQSAHTIEVLEKLKTRSPMDDSFDPHNPKDWQDAIDAAIKEEQSLRGEA